MGQVKYLKYEEITNVWENITDNWENLYVLLQEGGGAGGGGGYTLKEIQEFRANMQKRREEEEKKNAPEKTLTLYLKGKKIFTGKLNKRHAYVEVANPRIRKKKYIIDKK